MRRTTRVLFALMLSLAPTTTLLRAEDTTRIKLATLVPKGTSPHQILQIMGEKWRETSGGSVALTIYPDGTMGGEAEVVRRMRVGQLQAAMLTVQGLSEIDKSVSALQSMPMVFRSLDEVEFVREKLRSRIEKNFRDKGFVLLFWGDAGWVRFFAKEPVVRPADLKRMKLFSWAGDDDQVEIMKSAGLHPVSLETTDILTSLQTGLINAVPTIPLMALAGQFYGPSPYMLELNWAPLVGGTVITTKAWEAIPAAKRNDLLKAAADAGGQVTVRARKESNESVEAMAKRGLKIQRVSPELDAEWRKFAEEFYPKIRGTMVPADVFDEVLRLLKEFRSSGGQR